MHNVNRGDHRGDRRIQRSGPSEESQAEAQQGSAADAQTLDLNHATIAQLEAIDELGPELARVLIAQRVHQGHFSSWSELAKVPGMDAIKLAALKRVARLPGSEHG